MKRRGGAVVLAVVVAGCLFTACDQVNSAADQANSAITKANACGAALGLADLNPLVDPAKIKASAAEKEMRLRQLASQVQEQDVKNALLTMADSYVEAQKARFDDLVVVGKWAQRNAQHLDQLRKVCL
jgi:2C-methyl-D-erythritol 2,4-cyclodiphosphate synthase